MLTKPLIHGGKQLANAVQEAYSKGQTDYSIDPLILVDEVGNPVGRIKEGDSVIFCCRRGEREIELTEVFTDPDFSHFERQNFPETNFVLFTLYHEKFKHLPVAFAPAKLLNTLGECISHAGRYQFRCAESEKFAHVTFFLNGGNNQPFCGETDLLIPSPKGIPFDQVPELSLPRVTDEVIRAIHSDFDLVVTNFANGDVIGHTANNEAKIKCAEAIDVHLGRLVREAASEGMIVVITADHGNLEEMITATGDAHVAHTTNHVPLLIFDTRLNNPLQISDGKLADITPTILHMMGISQPVDISGVNLVENLPFGEDRNVLLIILDGWGNGKANETNPIHLANTPVWDELVKKYPPAELAASGNAVGLQAGKPGNSEAGHMNIGAGRIVLQDDIRLDAALADGSFFKNEVFQNTIGDVVRNNTALHLIGLLTEKSSHGSIDYPLALAKMAKEKGAQKIFLHIIFDGRSTAPGSAPAMLEILDAQLKQIGAGQIVDGIGRGIALDRDGNYSKIKKTYEALVSGTGQPYK